MLILLVCLIPFILCSTSEATINEEFINLGRNISTTSIRFGCLPSVWITLCKKLCRLQPRFCLNAIRAQTTTTTTPSPTTNEPTEPTTLNDLCNQPFSCVGKPNGQYENPWDCTDTITCDNGGIPTITRECPKEYWPNFNHNPHCQYRNSVGGMKSKPKQAPCDNLCDNEPPTAIPSTSPSTPTTTSSTPTTTPSTPASSSTASTPSSRHRPRNPRS